MNSRLAPHGVYFMWKSRGEGCEEGKVAGRAKIQAASGGIPVDCGLLGPEKIRPIRNSGVIAGYPIYGVHKLGECGGVIGECGQGERPGIWDIEGRAVVRSGIDVYFGQLVVDIVGDPPEDLGGAVHGSGDIFHEDIQPLASIASDGVLVAAGAGIR